MNPRGCACLTASFFVVLFSGSAVARAAAPAQPACPSLLSLLELVDSLNARDWSALTRQDIQALWHQPLAETVVWASDDPARGSLTLAHRIRDESGGRCLCCELFIFDISRTNTGVSREQLYSVILSNSTETWDKTLEVAQVLLLQLVPFDEGHILSSREWKPCGKEQEIRRSFYCTLPRGLKEEGGRTFDAGISKNGDLWTAFLSFNGTGCAKAWEAQASAD